MTDQAHLHERSDLSGLITKGAKVVAILTAGLVAAALANIDIAGPIRWIGAEAAKSITSATRIERGGKLMQYPILY
jgi:hypothetical protein